MAEDDDSEKLAELEQKRMELEISGFEQDVEFKRALVDEKRAGTARSDREDQRTSSNTKFMRFVLVAYYAGAFALTIADGVHFEHLNLPGIVLVGIFSAPVVKFGFDKLLKPGG